MTDLKSQRRLAAQILKIGKNRVWLDPERMDDVETAITREEIRKMIHEGVIKSMPQKGVSRARARILREKKRKGRRRGSGSRTGSPRARLSRKESWMRKIRALRKRLRELKAKKVIADTTYQKLYQMASSGRFESTADLDRYLKTHQLWRKH